MAVTAHIFNAAGAVLGQSVLKNKATVQVRSGERYRFVDDNGQLPKGLKIKQIGADAHVEWLDATAPNGTASMVLANFNTTPDVAISAPGLSTTSVQGLNYAADAGLVSSAAAPSAPAFTAPASSTDGWVTAGWLLGGGLAVAAVGGGSKGSASTTPPQTPSADTTPPGAPSIQAIATSNQNPATLSGTAEPGSTVQLTVGGAVFTVTAAADGTWTVNTTTSPHTGTYAPVANAATPVTAIATDAAGNASAPANTSFTVDTLAPTVQITPLATGVLNNASGTLTYTFTLSEAATDFDATDIQIAGGSFIAGSFMQTGLNTYTITATPTAGTNAASMVITVVAGAFHDAAGNSNALVTHTQAYDTLAPLAPTVDALAASSNAAPVLTGTAEAGSTVQLTVGGAVFTVVASSGGTWSVNTATTPHTGPFAPNTNGSNAVGIVSTDAAGNATAGSGASFVIDAAGPTIVGMVIVNAPSDLNYAVGETIQLQINFNEAVTYTGAGTATMAVKLGMADIDFVYNPLTGYFEHTVQPGELDTSGISTQAGDTIVLNGVTITDALGNTAVLTTNIALSASLNHTVGTEVHIIEGTPDADRAGIFWGQTQQGSEPGIGTGATAQITGGNRLWAGADSVNAGADDDFIYIYQADAGGADTINGGADYDAVIYDSFTHSITVDLANGTANLGAYGTQILQDIEVVVAGSGNDHIIGDGTENVLFDRSGNDTLDGGDGDDEIYDLDLLEDTIIGGSGEDRLRYTDGGATLRTTGVTVALSSTIATLDNDGNRISGIENLFTSQYADSIRGSNVGNRIVTYEGADWIDGGLGSDVVFAGEGNDTVVDGDETSDDLNGGDGIDLIDYSTSQPTPGLAFVFTPVTVNLDTGFTSRGGILTEFENLIGTALSDSIIGSAGSNSIFAGEGDDYLDGLGGANTLIGGLGDDTLISGSGINRLDGGADIDWASYTTSTAGVSVTLGGNNQLSSGVSSTGDVLINIEYLQGSSFGDTLTGDLNTNQIDGGDGADSLCGGLGSDEVIGGNGADTVFSSAGNLVLGLDHGDYYEGGDDASIDVLDLSARTDDLTFAVDLQGNTANLGDHVGSFSSAPFSIGGGPLIVGMENFYTGFERIIMGAGHDTFITNNSGVANGPNPAIWVNGGAGNDTISGGTANDTLFGGDGNDLIASAEGNNQVDGGNGYDTFNSNFAILLGPASGHTLNAVNATTLQHTDGVNATAFNTLVNVESFTLTGGNDTVNLTGYTQDITIDLGAGTGYDDVVSGSGNDSLYGMINAAAYGGAGNDTLRFAEGGTYYGNEGHDYFVDESTVSSLSTQLNDVFGGAGNDTFVGGLYSNIIVRYNDVTAGGVTVQLGAGNAGAGGAYGGVQVGVDTFYNVQNVVLTYQNDSAVGNELDNSFNGSGGGDTLLGMGGNDALTGGSASSNGGNYIDGGEGNDQLTGGQQTDTLLGGNGNDTIFGVDGADSINGGAGNDSIRGGIGNDSIYVQAQGGDRDTVYAGADNDIIDYMQAATGALGQSLFGEAGSDVIRISARPQLSDRYDGGAGVDVLQFTGNYVGGPAIDLSALTNAAAATGVIKGTEVLDFSQAVGATLTLDAASILNASNTDNILVITDNAGGGAAANTVYVSTTGLVGAGWGLYSGGSFSFSDSSQVVSAGGGTYTIANGGAATSNWTTATAYSQGAGNAYVVYSNGANTQFLLVDTDITTSAHLTFA